MNGAMAINQKKPWWQQKPLGQVGDGLRADPRVPPGEKIEELQHRVLIESPQA